MARADEIAGLRTAVQADPRNAPALARLAEQLLHEGETDTAASLIAEAAIAAPTDFTTQFLAAAILGIAGDVPAALERARMAVDLQGENEAALHQLGALLLRSDDPRAAAPILFKLVGLAPRNSAFWRLFADALHGGGNTARAVEAMRKAVELSPDEVEYHLHLAALLGALGRFGDAITVLDDVGRAAQSDARIYRMRSSFWAILDETALALDDAEQAAALAPDEAEYREHLAKLSGGISAPPDRRQAQLEGDWLPKRSAPAARREFRAARWERALAAQGRILIAIVLRETRTRFGHTRLGYLWAVIEPISHLLTLGLIFRLFNHAPPPVGDDLFLFYITGLIPFLVYWHISQDLISSLAGNASLLQMPVVRPLDVALARSLLYFATQLASGIVIFGIAELLGYQGLPEDLLNVAAALLTLWVLATGIGLINIVISTFIRSWETFFAAVNRLLYFASGIYYSPIFLPTRIRNMVTLNPVLQAVEWFRAGFYAHYDPPWVDRTYLMAWALSALLLGMALFRVFRKRLAMHR